MTRLFQCIVFCFFFIFSLSSPVAIFAEECDISNLQEMKEDDVVVMYKKCQSAWSQMEAAKKPHVSALNKMEADLKLFQLKIKSIEKDVAQKIVAIADGEKELSGFMILATRRIATLYRRTVSYNPLLPFITSQNVGSVLRAFTYQQKVINEDKKGDCPDCCIYTGFTRKEGKA